MKPKQIVVTKDNFNWVYSRLKKFFNHRYIFYWHTYNCGNKKRIGKKIDYGRYSKRPEKIHEHYSICPINVSLDKRLHGYINLDWPYNRWTIGIGDSITFIGNRIIHKNRWYSEDYLYYCFQIEGADKVYKNQFR